MLEDLNMRPGQDGVREPIARPSESSVVGDREVPINVTSPFDAMHRWLDGEGSEAEAGRDPEAARHLKLWRQVGAETRQMRREAAPAGLTDRIMAAIPATPMDTAVAIGPVGVSEKGTVLPSDSAVATANSTVSFWNRPVEVTPAAALTTAAGLVALGLAVGAAIKG